MRFYWKALLQLGGKKMEESEDATQFLLVPLYVIPTNGRNLVKSLESKISPLIYPADFDFNAAIYRIYQY